MIKFLKEHDHLQNGLNVLYLKGNSLSFKYLTRDPHELTVRTLRFLINPKQIKHHKALCYYTKQNYIIGGTADAIKIRTKR